MFEKKYAFVSTGKNKYGIPPKLIKIRFESGEGKATKKTTGQMTWMVILLYENSSEIEGQISQLIFSGLGHYLKCPQDRWLWSFRFDELYFFVIIWEVFTKYYWSW